LINSVEAESILTAHKLKVCSIRGNGNSKLVAASRINKWWNLFLEELLTNVEIKEADESDTEANQR